MGKLKTSLGGLAVLIDNVQKNGNDIVDALTSDATNVQKNLERMNGGYELLAMYLKQKALKEKADIKSWDKSTLKDHLDSEVANFVKGIEGARTDAVASFATWARDKSIKGAAVLGDIDRALALMVDIKAQIDKKRKRLLQSSKFKAKMAGYDTQLTDLGKRASTMRVDMKGEMDATQSSGPQSLERIKLTGATTIAQIMSQASLGLKREIDDIKKAADNPKRLAIAFKRYGEEVKGIRTWLAEADEMDAAGDEEKAEAKAPDPKPKLKKIIIKKGSTEIATAVTGDYDRATKLLVIPVVLWKKGSGDPLSLLQQKMTVSADYEKAEEGKFAVEMKLDKIAGDMKKATFKG